MYPRDSIELLHKFGAALVLLVGPLGLLFCQQAWESARHPWVGRVAPVFGGVGLAGGLLYLLQAPLFGPGLLERLAVYSVLFWLAICGGTVLANGLYGEPSGEKPNEEDLPE